MEQYIKGETKEVELLCPFPCMESCVLMRVGCESKVISLLDHALNKVQESDTSQVLWRGFGKAVNKTISCADIFETKINDFYRFAEVGYHRTEHYWEPQTSGLERLRVVQDLPAVVILFSKTTVSLDESEMKPELPQELQALLERSRGKPKKSSVEATNKQQKPRRQQKKSQNQSLKSSKSKIDNKRITGASDFDNTSRNGSQLEPESVENGKYSNNGRYSSSHKMSEREYRSYSNESNTITHSSYKGRHKKSERISDGKTDCEHVKTHRFTFKPKETTEKKDENRTNIESSTN